MNDDGTLRDVVVVAYISEFIDSLPFVFYQFTDNVLKFCDDPFNLSKVTDLQVLIDNENVSNWYDLKTLMAISSVSNSVTKHVMSIEYGAE